MIYSSVIMYVISVYPLRRVTVSEAPSHVTSCWPCPYGISQEEVIMTLLILSVWTVRLSTSVYGKCATLSYTQTLVRCDGPRPIMNCKTSQVGLTPKRVIKTYFSTLLVRLTGFSLKHKSRESMKRQSLAAITVVTKAGLASMFRWGSCNRSVA